MGSLMFRARCFVSSSLVLARPGRAVLALLELVHIADSVSESVADVGVCLSSNLEVWLSPGSPRWLSHDAHERDEVEICIV